MQTLISTSDGCRECITFSVGQLGNWSSNISLLDSTAEMKLMIALALPFPAESVGGISSFFFSLCFFSGLAFFQHPTHKENGSVFNFPLGYCLYGEISLLHF